MFTTYNFYHEYVSASGVNDSWPTDINAQMTHGKVLNVLVVCSGVTETLTIHDTSVEFIGINFSLKRR